MESTGGMSGLFRRVFAWASSRRFKAGLVTAVVVAASFLIANHAFAFSLDDLGNWALGQLGTLLNVIIEFLGNLIILLTNILIEFASYNHFVHAPAVEIGWVLVRDVVNMFFIVVLLVSAFSTIIGYSEFHYSKVLPKLLLMAVLINFSKTLIGLLIDFSQVLMLTFVNAFKPAAGGNFVNLLKLSKATSLRTDLENIPDSESLVKLLVASLLAIFMLSIVLTILVIMVAFILYRIIGLWMILIMSPMAFFALALPGKMGKGLSTFTSTFWSRLSGFLVSGPVMAFYIWLALAIAQGGSGFSELYNRQSSEIDSASTAFSNVIGKPEELSAFIVAVAFLLAGVEFAVKAAKEVSPTLGQFASNVAHGGGAVINIPRYAARLTGQTARVGAGVAQRGFGAADYVTGGALRSGIGRAGLAVSGRLGGVGAATFAEMATYKGRKVKAKQAELAKLTAELDPATRDKYLRARAGSVFSKEAAAAQISLGAAATTSAGRKVSRERIEEELKKTHPNLSAEDRRALAEAKALELASADIEAGKKMAEKVGDDANVGKFKEALEKNPSLSPDWTDLAEIKGEGVVDVKKYLEKVSTDSVKDGRTAIARMKALGLIDEQGNIVRDDRNEDTWKLLMKGDRGKIIQKHVDAYKDKPEAVLNMLAAMDGKGDVAKANADRYFVTKDGKGNLGGAFFETAGSKAAAAVENASQQRQAAARERLASIADQGSREASEARSALAGAGATLAEAYKLQNGVFDDASSRSAFAEAMQNAAKGLSAQQDASLDWIANLDVESLAANPGGMNEARQTAALALTNEALLAGYEKAVEQKNTEAQKKIRQLIDLIDAEGRRLEKQLGDMQIGRADIAGIATNPTSAASVATMSRMASGGVANPQAAAGTVARAWDLRNDQRTYALRSSITSRAAQSAGRTAQSASESVSGAVSAAAGAVREARSRTPEQRMEERLSRRASRQARRGELPPDVEPPKKEDT